jgi:hypothetical protein
MTGIPRARHGALVLATFVVMLCQAGCESPASPSADGSRLRIVNTGPAGAVALTVLFPDDQIVFGNVSAGATTSYRPVPNGVCRYAAYRLEVDGVIVTQPVIDWVGETPMEGRAFTYTIDVDTRRSRSQIVRLMNVTRDD